MALRSWGSPEELKHLRAAGQKDLLSGAMPAAFDAGYREALPLMQSRTYCGDQAEPDTLRFAGFGKYRKEN